MFKTIVRRRAYRLYAALNAANPRPMVESFAPEFAYTFTGTGHALAGTRRTKEHMQAQLDRVLRLFPGLHFDVRQVVVNGFPWNTNVAVRIAVRARLQDGSAYENDIVQLLRLRWGRVIRVRTVIDTGRLTAALQRLEQHGIAEAAAVPVS